MTHILQCTKKWEVDKRKLIKEREKEDVREQYEKHEKDKNKLYTSIVTEIGSLVKINLNKTMCMFKLGLFILTL